MSAPAGVFVTGTDTGVGKTRVAAALIRALTHRGLPALGMKPVASGCRRTEQGLRSADAEALLAAGASAAPYPLVNPYALEPAVAPHLAAEEVGIRLRFEHIRHCHRQLLTLAPTVIVEGVGGWRVPLGPDGEVADLAAALRLPVLLVVGLRLGCINHALMTADAVLARGLTLAGWVASAVDPEMSHVTGNLRTLSQRLPAACLGILSHRPAASADLEATALDLHRLGC